MTTFILIMALNIGGYGQTAFTHEFRGERACIVAAENFIKKYKEAGGANRIAWTCEVGNAVNLPKDKK